MKATRKISDWCNEKVHHQVSSGTGDVGGLKLVSFDPLHFERPYQVCLVPSDTEAQH